MNILFLTSQLPYPQVSGGVIKSYKLIDYLSDIHSVTLGCLLKSSKEEANLAEFRQHMPQLEVFVQPLVIARTPISLLKSYLAGVPLNIYRNQSAGFNQAVTTLAEDFDAIFVDH